MMQATRKRQHRSGRELAGVREGRSPRRSRDRHETGRRYAKAISTNLCQKGTTEEDIMDTISVCENSKNTKECSETRQLEDTTVNDNNATEKAFPWLLEFNKIVCSSRGNRNYQHLKQLLLYTQKVLSVETSNVKLDPINLKNNINNILIFFHLYWLDIKQETADHSLYLNKMSALLSVYIDMDRDIDRDIHMELKTSRQEEEEIDLKILAALCIYLKFVCRRTRKIMQWRDRL